MIGRLQRISCDGRRMRCARRPRFGSPNPSSVVATAKNSQPADARLAAVAYVGQPILSSHPHGDIEVSRTGDCEIVQNYAHSPAWGTAKGVRIPTVLPTGLCPPEIGTVFCILVPTPLRATVKR